MKKKIITTTASIAVLIGIAAGIWFLQRGDDGQVAQNTTCAVDVNSLLLKDAEGLLKTDEEIVRAIFSHYFDGYKQIPDCPTAGIKNHRIASVGKITREDDHILAEIVFDLEPLSLDETEWDTPETAVEDGWIRGKKGTLSIQKSEDVYYLVL